MISFTLKNMSKNSLLNVNPYSAFKLATAISKAPSRVVLPPINPVLWQNMQFLIPAISLNISSLTPHQSLCRGFLKY